MKTTKIGLKRIYNDYSEEDGYRILLDRLWPRGIKKENAYIDLWLKEIAPSTELRKWFNHEEEKFLTFREKYLNELKENQEIFEELKNIVRKHKRVTFLFAAKNEQYNHTTLLKDLLDELEN